MLTISIISDRSIDTTECQTIINFISCDGVLDFDIIEKYPIMSAKIINFCQNNLFDSGKLWLYKETKENWIVNFPIKTLYSDSFNIKFLETGLDKLVETYKEKGIKHIAFPPINNDYAIDLILTKLVKCDNLIVEIYKNFNNNNN